MPTLALMLVVAAAAVYLNHHLQRTADASRHAQLVLARLEARAQELSAAEWQAIAEGQLDEETQERAEHAEADMRADLATLGGLGNAQPELEAVTAAAETYAEAIHEEFRLLADRDVATAREVDAARVDPAFEHLLEAVRKASAAYEGAARRTIRQTTISAAIVVVGAMTVVVILLVRITRGQRALEQAALEQQLLRRANDELDRRVAERTDELARTQERLIVTARQAGMAEVADNVLHNAGNVLNGVTVAASLVVDRLRTSPLADLPPAAALLHQHATDLPAFLTTDPRGRQLPAFLDLLAEHWTREHAALLSEMETVTTHVQQIRDIIRRQQASSRLCGSVEEVSVTDLIEDALALNDVGLMSDAVAVERDLAVLPTLTLDPVKVTQILVNLVRNAQESLAAAGRPDGRITVRSRWSPDGDLRVDVIDTGVGIAPEHRERLFTHGFTTKPRGHGFGLHASTLAAREMGGTLTADSEGPGRGACFTLVLPVPAPAQTEPFA